MAAASAKNFCRCIKGVRKSLKKRGAARAGSTYEQGAIAICTKSMLQSRGKTLRKFTCRKKQMLETQALRQRNKD